MTTTAKQWEMRGETKGFDELHFIDTPIPNPGQYEVLVKFYAASLNYRDITIPKVSKTHLVESHHTAKSMYRVCILSPGPSLECPALMVRV